jgi:hypothetical protein
VPDVGPSGLGDSAAVPLYLLHHQHCPVDCAAAFAAWNGFDSPLRRRAASASCLTGGHAVWWRVHATDAAAALALLPRFVSRRTTAVEVRDVEIP